MQLLKNAFSPSNILFLFLLLVAAKVATTAKNKRRKRGREEREKKQIVQCKKEKENKRENDGGRKGLSHSTFHHNISITQEVINEYICKIQKVKRNSYRS